FSTSNTALELPCLNLSATFNLVLDYSTLIKAAMTNKSIGPMPEDKYCDLILRCEGEEMRVHRVVMCGGSRLLDLMFDDCAQEGSYAVIDLRGEEVNTVRRAIAFLYLGEYTAGQLLTTTTDDGEDRTTLSDAQSNDSVLFIHADMYAFGYKFKIPELQHFAAVEFSQTVRYGDAWATEALPMLINKVYDSTPPSERELRNAISEICALHAELLIPIPELVEVMNKVPGVAMDVLAMVQKLRVFQESEFSQVEERCAKEVDSALEYSQSLEKMIKKIEAENETLRQKGLKAVRNAEKAQDESMALRYANGELETQVSDLSQTIEKYRTSEETMEKNQPNHNYEVMELKLQNSILERAKMQADSDLRVAKEASAKAKAQTSIETAKLDTVIERSKRWEQCRHCGKDFNGRVQRTSDGDTLLRCDYCQTRHW
ncbi:MAG: hypothetical protein M1835_000976, partial [Candelina submexicana]